ncbi:MAG: phosphoribosylformylglycinamidine synthase [Burkholderiales bacterium]|jgi:phosphoribosylformylglycinamidine synthase|nr:phosphoribosylformylglycinamidine synthase [Burkholderiales bacterium]
MHITYIKGKPALSKIRLNKLEQNLCSKISCYEIYLITSQLMPSPDVMGGLTQLLDGNLISTPELGTTKCIIVPRFGTVSPWSSKATEIANRCGLNQINRIEKALYFVSDTSLEAIYPLIHDRMTESIIDNERLLNNIFIHHQSKTYTQIDILTAGITALEQANITMGLALSPDEIDYLYINYKKLSRNPTDTELMMFSQANSEHCRHKIFNALFVIDGKEQDKTLFDMIKDTYKNAPDNIIAAYNDNSSIINGAKFERLYANPITHGYDFSPELTHVLMKVETHNHPTAIAPFSGSATGSGGEIRDEGATGRGSKPKAGLCGFSVSNLGLENVTLSSNYGKPDHIKSALDIMLEAPIGSASFNNEFGRPNLCGYFRSFEQNVGDTIYYGYHKPIMLAGGYGNINNLHTHKNKITDGAMIIQLGGPGFLIGVGGGSASSMSGGDNAQELDFNSVQRSNPEMERRAQEVIDSCVALGVHNPIMSIHDVGAGGLSNAVPELINESGMGGTFYLRDIPIYDQGMSPLEIWCNESQERYVLAIAPEHLTKFEAICRRENCPYSVLGKAYKEKRLIVLDKKHKNSPVDMPMDVLLGKPPRTVKNIKSIDLQFDNTFNAASIDTKTMLYKVIAHPTVASKSFLITIGDRSVGGHTVRDQMVGRYQVPVADCAITAFGYNATNGEAMAIGERTPIATLNAPASARMAIAESLTNLSSCHIAKLGDIKLSANWMASCGNDYQEAQLYKTVAAASELCKYLNIAIPVGKDSLSMKMSWDGKHVISPVSLIISAFTTVNNVRNHKTPELSADTDTSLVLLTLDEQTRMGASIAQECYNQISGETPDVDNFAALTELFNIISKLHLAQKILAYHDKGDGGLAATLCEMIFASRIGIKLDIAVDNINNFLFNEEIGVVIQIKNSDLDMVNELCGNIKCTVLGAINIEVDNLQIINHSKLIIDEPREKLQLSWSMVAHTIQKMRDNPQCADAELKTISQDNMGLFAKTSFDIQVLQNYEVPMLNLNKPKVAILREQGVNGHIEMAAGFVKAGFDAIDVHLNDILNGPVRLGQFVGLAVCGGFSYGDVLGAGSGFAKSILFNPTLKRRFSAFFNRKETFTLGVCNGCQMLSQLTEIIPGTEAFPKFIRNESEQFEARLTMVQIEKSSSVLLQEMEGSQLPIVVSHGEGKAHFENMDCLDKVQTAMSYIDSLGAITETYPYNPNGSPQGIAGVTSLDGRVTIMMPHPERIIRTQQMSWHDKAWGEMSPWFKIFTNARSFVG